MILCRWYAYLILSVGNFEVSTSSVPSSNYVLVKSFLLSCKKLKWMPSSFGHFCTISAGQNMHKCPVATSGVGSSLLYILQKLWVEICLQSEINLSIVIWREGQFEKQTSRLKSTWRKIQITVTAYLPLMYDVTHRNTGCWTDGDICMQILSEASDHAYVKSEQLPWYIWIVHDPDISYPPSVHYPPPLPSFSPKEI